MVKINHLIKQVVGLAYIRKLVNTSLSMEEIRFGFSFQQGEVIILLLFGLEWNLSLAENATVQIGSPKLTDP